MARKFCRTVEAITTASPATLAPSRAETSNGRNSAGNVASQVPIHAQDKKNEREDRASNSRHPDSSACGESMGWMVKRMSFANGLLSRSDSGFTAWANASPV